MEMEDWNYDDNVAILRHSRLPVFKYTLTNEQITQIFMLNHTNLKSFMKEKIQLGHRKIEVGNCTGNYIFLDEYKNPRYIGEAEPFRKRFTGHTRLKEGWVTN
ncbi:MAG: GIY-YIG nuclease family protein, partial [Candidatus Hodarchaeota archaeon]